MKAEGRRQRTQQYWKGTQRYQAGAWRDDETSFPKQAYLLGQSRQLAKFDTLERDPREQSRLIELLGLINYRILTGSRVYIEVDGTVYRTLFGAYWRSVFTGVEHYLLKCQEVSGVIWTEGSTAVDMIDLPIAHTKNGWTAQGHSLMFMLNRD